MTYWSVHTHSRYSAKDALPTVEAIVSKAVELRYPALGLTDHGNPGGAAALYTACRKAGIEPLPGMEAYVALDRNKVDPASKRAKTMHLGIVATSGVGYRNLVGLATQASRQFRFTPILDLPDLAAAGADGRLDGLAVLSGCWFGLLPTMLRTGDEGAVRNMLIALDGWFGSGLYVEMQHHGIFKEATATEPRQMDHEHVAWLHRLAVELGLPAVITQDSHYCNAEDRPIHDTMKSLVSWSDDPDDALFPGDGYHMVQEDWMALRYTPKQLGYGLEGLEDLRSKAKVVIPELDEFKLKVPDTGGDPEQELRTAVIRGLNAKVDSGQLKVSNKKAYDERIADEMDVLVEAGFCGYMLVAKKVADHMRESDIVFSVRGSASGSLVLWALGVTTLDPIKCKLPFDRFLSRDRTKPPDIDFDVEHRRRGEVIAWMESQWHVEKICTYLQLGLDDEEESEGKQKGSLLVRWKMNYRKTHRLAPGAPIPKVPDDEWRRLQEVAAFKPYNSYGVHPAGLLITPDAATAACVPMSYVASSKTMVTAFGKKDIERMGLVKLDLLGLRTLTAVRLAYQWAGIGPQHVVFNDPKAFALMRSGRTTGLFQLEGGASARGVVQLKPRKLLDVVAAMALFRPATLDSGATKTFIARRNGEEAIVERHPIIMEETAETYGVLLYQEQALAVMKRLGLTVEEIEEARDAIKASNEHVDNARAVLERLRGKIQGGGRAAGMSRADSIWLDEALDAYAGYGFNRAHAYSYGVLSYVTAWLRVNYPVPFWAGMLNAYADSQMEVWYGPRGQRSKIPQIRAYQLEAAKDGVTLMRPHVNKSQVSWAMDPSGKAVRAGFVSIKGVGPKAAEELAAKAPYADLSDLMMKVNARTVTGVKDLALGHSPVACAGVIGKLAHAGALHGLDPVPPPEPKKRRGA